MSVADGLGLAVPSAPTTAPRPGDPEEAGLAEGLGAGLTDGVSDAVDALGSGLALGFGLDLSDGPVE